MGITGASSAIVPERKKRDLNVIDIISNSEKPTGEMSMVNCRIKLQELQDCGRSRGIVVIVRMSISKSFM